MEEFISTDLGNFFLYTNAQAFEINIGNANKLGVAAKTENGDGTFRNVSFICDYYDSNNNDITFRNISDSGRKNVDLIVQATKTDVYNLISIGEANSISQKDFEEKVNDLVRIEKEREDAKSPFIKVLENCSLSDLYALSDVLRLSDFNEAVTNFRDFDEHFSVFDVRDLLDFIRYNDVTEYQDNNDFLLDIRDNTFISEDDAVKELVYDYGDDIYEALKEARENGNFDDLNLDDINYDLTEAFEETLAAEEKAEKQNLKESNTKGRKI